MRVLIVGHPRSGTAYAAECFERTAGWEVGHELVRDDGIASWMWAAPSYWAPWGPARGDTKLPPVVLNILREPHKCVSSVAHVEEGSEEWRRNWIKLPDNGCGAIERAVWSVYGWTRLIKTQTPPTHTAQTEHVERAVAEITGEERLGCSGYLNNRAHPRFSADEIKATTWLHPETASLWDCIQSDYADASSPEDDK